MENKLIKVEQNNIMDNYVKTDDIPKDMCGIIESSRQAVYGMNISLMHYPMMSWTKSGHGSLHLYDILIFIYRKYALNGDLVMLNRLRYNSLNGIIISSIFS